MISKEEVEHIAKLARLDLTEKETEKMQKDLSAILDYFDLLQKAPKPKPAQILLEQKTCNDSLRKDEILERDAGLAERIVEASPDKKDGYIKVKTIL